MIGGAGCAFSGTTDRAFVGRDESSNAFRSGTIDAAGNVQRYLQSTKPAVSRFAGVLGAADTTSPALVGGMA